MFKKRRAFPPRPEETRLPSLRWVNMPVMDGFQFLAEVKKNTTYKFTPVIMLTTESADNMKQRGKELGARAWVCKPFAPEKLVDAVQRLCLP